VILTLFVCLAAIIRKRRHDLTEQLLSIVNPIAENVLMQFGLMSVGGTSTDSTCTSRNSRRVVIVAIGEADSG